MLEFLAFVIAIIALVIASKARSEARELRKLMEASAPPRPFVPPAGYQPLEQTPPPPPAPEPQPVPAPVAAFTTPEPEPTANPIPPYVPPQPPPAPKPASVAKSIDWESLVGIKLFGWIAGIALVLAAVFLFKYSVDHGWLR
ncbi:MAG TPA: hypothetical protein VF787_17675, partial [Thermoanaerobaculia bacterium]